MEVYTHSNYEFHVVKKLGAGAFGEVYEVSLPTCNFKYALKKFSIPVELCIAISLIFNDIFEMVSFSEIEYETYKSEKKIPVNNSIINNLRFIL